MPEVQSLVRALSTVHRLPSTTIEHPSQPGLKVMRHKLILPFLIAGALKKERQEVARMAAAS